MTGSLDSNLRLQAVYVENAIHAQPDFWDLNPDRMRASYERFVVPGEHFQIINKNGESIVELGPTLAWHFLVRSYPLHDFGVEVGHVETGKSILNLIWLGLLLFGVSLGAAWLIWGPLRRQPLAALAEAENHLRLRDQYQRALLDNFPFAIWLKDTDSRYLSVNNVFARSVGIDNPDALVGKDDFDIMPPEIAGRFKADDRAMLDSREKTSVEEELPIAGAHGWYETYKAPVIGDNGELLGTVGFARDISGRKRTEEELRLSETIHAKMVANINDVIIIVDKDGFNKYRSPNIERLFGWLPNELDGISAWENVHADDRTFIQKLFGEIIRTPNAIAETEFRFRCKGGNYRWVHITAMNLLHDPDIQGVLANYHDITERKQSEEEIRLSEARLRRAELASKSGNWELHLDSMTIIASEGAGKLYGIDNCEFDYATAQKVALPEYRPMLDAALRNLIENNEPYEVEFKIRTADTGELREIDSVAYLNKEDRILFGIIRDITERKHAEKTINRLAFFDQLTDLPNRTLLRDRLKQALANSQRSGSYGALLLIDLDYFKTLNDTLGHDMGDLLLKMVAQRLTECVREEDTVARQGGDEFVVMLVSLSESQREAASRIERVGRKIIAALNQTYELKSIPYRISPSIGVSVFLGQQDEADTLLKQADLAMYKAKDAGRNTLRFFDPDMARDVLKRVSLDHDLREAVQKEQFVLHYQAQVTGNRVTGSEALLRWQHPERGLVFPGEFIAVIEETGLILPVGQWVLERACKQLADWATQPEMSHLTVAVNISARQINHEGFVNQVLMALDRSGANPQRLKLELTESLLVNNVEETIGKMAVLKARGVGFSLDDFGTGYSSLSYLKRMPLDQLKIDQSFVRDLLTDPNDAAIAKMIVVLAETLGLTVIAEGVETEAQRDLLTQNGCHAYQGYFFSRPLPLDEFESFVKRGDGCSDHNGVFRNS